MNKQVLDKMISEINNVIGEDLKYTFEDMHRLDEMVTISRPSDCIPKKTKVCVYGENDEQGTKTPHFHVVIDNGEIEMEVKFEHIRKMTIWRTKNNYPLSWNSHTNVRDRIVDWFDETNSKNFGLSNLRRMIIAWNDANPTNEINEVFCD